MFDLEQNRACDMDDEANVRPYLLGVVEGFYGRPWKMNERSELFTLMSAWGMNAYIYAPKDDHKHRAYWRDLYTDEELGAWFPRPP